MLKISQSGFENFQKFSPIMLFQCSHYACIMVHNIFLQ